MKRNLFFRRHDSAEEGGHRDVLQKCTNCAARLVFGCDELMIDFNLKLGAT